LVKIAPSAAVGMSTSTTSSPWNRWCSMWYRLKEAEAGIPMGMFANCAGAERSEAERGAFLMEQGGGASEPNEYE